RLLSASFCLLEEQHEPARPVHLGRGEGADTVLLTRAFEDKLQRLGPLVIDAGRVRPPQRLDGVVTATGNSLAGACVLQLAKPIAPGNRCLLVEGVTDLGCTAQRRDRAAIRREFVPGEQEGRAHSATVI